jgi:type I restriction enzyme M protein
MQPREDGGSRVAIIMNGSPLFTGDTGSGEGEIRRWILEHDWLEALVALPVQLFYNTGIATYVWVLTNRKSPARQGKVQLIDATSLWVPMRKGLGDKRREIPPDRAAQILRLLHAFQNLAVSKKRDAWAKSVQEADGQALQQAIRAMLATLPEMLFRDRDTFLKVLQQASKHAGLKLPASVHKAILSALAERDETATICRDKDGHPEPDPELRDTESVPLTERIEDFFAREVQLHVPDAWINTAVRDEKDGEVGKVGYEINFNRYFYKYQPPRPLEEIEADIKTLAREILEMLRDLAG